MKETAQKDPSKWILKFQSCKDSHKWSAFCPAFPDAVAPIFQACRGWGLQDLSTKISLYLPQLIWLPPNHNSHPGSLPHCTPLNPSKQQLCALFYGLYMPTSLSIAWRILTTRLFLKDVEYCAQIYFVGYEWAVSVRQPFPYHYSCCRRAVWAHEPGPFQTHTCELLKWQLPGCRQNKSARVKDGWETCHSYRFHLLSVCLLQSKQSNNWCLVKAVKLKDIIF